MPSDDLLSPRSLSEPHARTRPGHRTGSGLRRPAARGVGGLLLSAALVGTAVLSTSSATAAPKPTIAQAKATIEKLKHQQEQASEEYNDTREELKSVDVRLKAARVKLDRQRVELKKAKVQMGYLAAETYRRGELSTLGVVLGDDPSSALAQAGYLPSLGQRQNGAIEKLTAGEQKLIDAEKDIKEQQAKAKKAKTNLIKTRSTVEKKIDDAEAELAKLTAAQRARVVSAVANADNPPSSSGGSGGSGGSSGAGGSASCAGKSVTAATAAGRAAINFACGQLGDPYVWAAAGPSSWDCSGLTMKAFAAGGVSLPHSSKQQAGYGTPVSNANLQPGDLVFFNSPISHVGIYLGNNTMVHAPNSSTVVKVASLYQTPSAAVRL